MPSRRVVLVEVVDAVGDVLRTTWRQGRADGVAANARVCGRQGEARLGREAERREEAMVAAGGEGLGKWDVVAAAVDTSGERKEGPGFFLELIALLPHRRR